MMRGATLLLFITFFIVIQPSCSQNFGLFLSEFGISKNAINAINSFLPALKNITLNKASCSVGFLQGLDILRPTLESCSLVSEPVIRFSPEKSLIELLSFRINCSIYLEYSRGGWFTSTRRGNLTVTSSFNFTIENTYSQPGQELTVSSSFTINNSANLSSFNLTNDHNDLTENLGSCVTSSLLSQIPPLLENTLKQAYKTSANELRMLNKFLNVASNYSGADIQINKTAYQFNVTPQGLFTIFTGSLGEAPIKLNFPRVDPSKEAYFFIHRNLILAITSSATRNGLWQLSLRESDTVKVPDFGYRIADMLRLVPELKQKYNPDEAVFIDCGSNVVEGVLFNEMSNRIVVENKWSCNVKASRSNEEVFAFSLRLNLFLRVLPQKTLMGVVLEKITYNKEGVLATSHTLETYRQSTLEYMVAHGFRSFVGKEVFNVEFPIQNIKEDGLYVDGDYLMIYGHAL